MIIKEFKTNNGSFLAVKVPSDAVHFKTSGIGYLCYKITKKGKWIVLNEISEPNEIYNDYTPISLLSKITEEQAKEVVEPIKRYVGVLNVFGYKSYLNPLDLFETALESFNSLMQANEIYSENPHQKSYFNPEEFIQEEYERFMEAQENTGNWLILKKSS